ncbi:hypothetical protein OG339_48765 (plasmid) [Streptosporangium sp. NBC_01495]|uniref:hypothetical protein n=1 Tax=Streptosporangium sp. NBC_01495 TaxID=2903899 RepID=UPI002E3351DC|nr:hypothetical protein [Streptosporangium sp. NBC_01495]
MTTDTAEHDPWMLWTMDDPPPHVPWDVPAWTTPSYQRAKTVMFMAMCADPAGDVHAAMTAMVAPLMDTAAAIGRHATQRRSTTVTVRCGLTLLAGHAVARTQHALAAHESPLAAHIQQVTRTLWPKATRAKPPRPSSIHATLNLHRYMRAFGDGGVPYLADLVTLGTSSGPTYAAALRNLLRRVANPGSVTLKARFADPLYEQVHTLLKES